MRSLQTEGVAARDFLISHDLSRNAATAIVAVLWYESKLDPGPQGVQSSETPGALNPSGAYGLASWNGPRQQALVNFVTSKGLPVENVETQLLFVLTEAANSYPKTWAAIKSGGSYVDIIPVFVADYENPRDHVKEINGSMGFAATLYYLQSPVQKPVPAPDVPPVPVPVPVPLPHGADPELMVLERLLGIISGLPYAERSRIVAYLASRFQ